MAYDVWIGRLLDETITCFAVSIEIDLVWRELAYDLWAAYDMRIGRLLDEITVHFALRGSSLRLLWSIRSMVDT